jgi:hypothetical protein
VPSGDVRRVASAVRRRSAVACWIAAVALLVAACTSPDGGGARPGSGNAHTPLASPGDGGSPEPTRDEPQPGSVTVAAAGDISENELGDQKATSDLILDEDPDRVLVLGDSQYEKGSLDDFADYYDPTWGRFKDQTSPAPGNHDKYGSSGYEEYFDPPGAWYSFDLGRWHFVSLDSNRPEHNSQLNFLERDLEDDDHLCELAFWHHARWSSGSDHGNTGSAQALWERAVEAGVDLVLTAHEHVYERFDRLDEDGQPAPDGTYQIIVGTGGGEQHDDFFDEPLAGSRARIEQTFGVLFLELNRTSFAGEYKTVDGRVLDRFEGDCR